METKSKRDRVKYEHEGHLFCFAKFNSDMSVKFWRCDKRDSDDCKARLHTSSETGEVIKLISVHTHGSDAAGVAASKIRTAIKRRAEETLEAPSTIVNQALEGAPIAVQGKIGNADALKKIIQRKRVVVQAAPAQPADLTSLVIPEIYQTYELTPGQEEKFLLIDTGMGDTSRILIFGRHSTINWAHQMERVYVDGTFRIAPTLFSQVYVIMAERGGFVVPILYALLPNKTEETYRRMWEKIKNLWSNFKPTSISTDFEQAALNSIRYAFPGVQLFGCLFHLQKNMRKKLSDEGLMSLYNNNPDFALAARKIVALAFVPPTSMEDAFEDLCNETPHELQPILNWFEDSYLGRPNRRGVRRPAMFPIHVWTVYERTLNGNARTNNFVEAAHRRMQVEFGVDHPTLWKFIDGIRKIQAGRDHHYEQFVRGEEPPHKRKKYLRADERILKIVQEYANRTNDEYLRGIAHNFLMN